MSSMVDMIKFLVFQTMIGFGCVKHLKTQTTCFVFSTVTYGGFVC